MSGAKIEMTFQDAGLRRDQIEQIERLEDRTEFFQHMGEALTPVVRYRFKEEKAPDAVPRTCGDGSCWRGTGPSGP